MECQECHKRPATLHFTQVINGNKTEVHVCEVCAKEKGYMSFPDEAYTLHNLITGLFDFDSSINPQKKAHLKQSKELQCPKCEMTFSDFKRLGKFGCAECYNTFSSKLDPVFRRVHSGNTLHHGKIPKRKGGHLHLKKELDSLRIELQSLIKNEEFEKAATIRDQIKDLEQTIKNKEEGEAE
ncbi:UvrB/UvrC motif-containing protein [Virgibacillus sp. MSJ-26]|uniref:UvrB/UvrC motif-containing protein n=1 Tax=Virgibacillus sp. MSJ-26 TaxID=2841522 RepID=UPI001C0FA64F|nr:UvrB/UvrC motif-containing protein [Virgibacillus sp. MSJ-26]MBU5467976.1 UvrB/UvrC motif-containing protein [Virgibacillus sp. MSJ-26]